MKIYNTLTRKKEEFIPREDGPSQGFGAAGKKVKMFVCGPTVYDYIHIGNARTFAFFDFVAKYLRFKGYDVEYIQNITDIDDRIIRKAKASGKTFSEIAIKYELIFRKDIEALGIAGVSKYIFASEHIPDIISQITKLIDKRNAYFIENDGWYFDLNTFPDYGKLSGRTGQMADDAVSRIDDSDRKRNRGDFCLWKVSKEGEPSWDFETGKYLGISDGGPAFAESSAGRPGWHIEDTTITEKYFGSQYDIHGGGRDLMFPHHEAEIAQQASAAGIRPEDFVKYWMHTGFLINKTGKMSKSFGSFVTLDDALKKYSPETLKYYFFSSHYHSSLEYSEELLDANVRAIENIHNFLTYKKFYWDKVVSKGETKDLDRLADKIYGEIDDDFNLPSAIGQFFELITAAEPLLKQGYSSTALDRAVNFMDVVVGIIPKISGIPQNIRKLAKDRERERISKNFNEADELRQKILDLGYEIEDTAFGALLKKRAK